MPGQRDDRAHARQDGADRLHKTLWRARNELRWAQPRCDDRRREAPERTERRAGQDARDKAVSQHREKPLAARGERHDRQRADGSGDDPRRLLIDRIRKPEQRRHNKDCTNLTNSVRFARSRACYPENPDTALRAAEAEDLG